MSGDFPRRKWGDHYDRARHAEPVGDLVELVLEQNHLHVNIREQLLFDEWASFVGERVGARTRPETIVDRTLVVEVANHAWLHELRLLRPKIVADVLDKLGMPRFFDDIKFVLAKEGRRREPTKVPTRRRAVLPSPIEPTPAQGARIGEILRDASKVEDPELRALISAVRIAHDK